MKQITSLENSIKALQDQRLEELKFYDKAFLKDSLYLLKSQLEDLSMWSVVNGDKFNEEISLIKEAIELIEKHD